VHASGEDPVTANQSTYDAIAVDYAERSHAPWPDLILLVDAFVARLADNDLVLDVGCGTGRDVGLARSWSHGVRS
jgi:methylase of polypeptide subunit release factors